MRRRLLASALAVIAALASSGCEPGTIRTIYALEDIYGNPLPLVLQESPYLRLLSRRITLYKDGSFTHVSQLDTNAGPHVDVRTETTSGRYRIVESTLELSYLNAEGFQFGYDEFRVRNGGALLTQDDGIGTKYVYRATTLF